MIRAHSETTWWMWGIGMASAWYIRGEARGQWARELRLLARIGPWTGSVNIYIPKTLWARMGGR
jgi:hypothetical protein